MPSMLVGFELESRMPQIEVSSETTLELVQDLGCQSVGEAVVVNDNVRRKRRKTRHHDPRMEIMDADHVLNRQKVVTDLGEIYARRSRF